MSEETPQMAVVPCVQCGGFSVAAVQFAPGGPHVNVCATHYHEWESSRQRQIRVYGELADRAEDDIADAFGIPRKNRPVRIPSPEVNVQQINIHGPNLGVVNTGTVGTISNNLTVINGQDPALAGALKELTERVIASTVLNDSQKQEAADLLNEIVADAAKPAEQRRSRTVTRTIAGALSQMLAHSADLYTLWTAIQPHLY